MEAADGNAKWLGIFRTLQKNLRDGAYPPGVPVPSEAMLARKFDVSRITVVRAMEELRKRGLVWSKRGSGTFATRAACQESGRIGLIMPSLSVGEIFPPICQALTRFAQQDGIRSSWAISPPPRRMDGRARPARPRGGSSSRASRASSSSRLRSCRRRSA